MSRYKPKPIAPCPPDRITINSYALMHGEAGGYIPLTLVSDTVRYNVVVPPERVIPIILLPGIMGSNLRQTAERQEQMGRSNNVVWRPDASMLYFQPGRILQPPSRRQRMLDPDSTEVDRYDLAAEEAGEPDLERLTLDDLFRLNANNRHKNVPDNLPDIGLLRNPPALPPGSIERDKPFTAAEVARWRGWSEVAYGFYGTVLQTLEEALNNIVCVNAQGEAGLSANWPVPGAEPGSAGEGKPAQQGAHGVPAVIGIDPQEWGASGGLPPVSEDDLYCIHDCWYPVHAIGYNWTQSNAVSAGKVAERIREVMKCYTDNGRLCDKVIIITHSMGGLVASALLHPAYAGNIADSILGIVHSVQPATGAAETYKRFRAGAALVPNAGSKESFKQNMTTRVLGRRGRQATAVLANTPGGLELLPAPHYALGRDGAGQDTSGWLQVQTKQHQVLAQWPSTPLAAVTAAGSAASYADKDPLSDIYLAGPEQWWRLLNPQWINPAGKQYENQTAYQAVQERLQRAQAFHHTIRDLYHPNTYASYGENTDKLAYGRVIWQVQEEGVWSHPRGWRLLSEAYGDKQGNKGKGWLKVQTPEGQTLTLLLRPEADAGDDTVPSKASASRQRAKVIFVQKGYGHANSYSDPKVLASTLYSIIKMVREHAETWPERED
ncbi:GPI inositol-deacylase [Neisseriaceae bacterium TC5R-5]|nr:GPI inositol-deacylase [Neisseriaceae bacterium TC5R-5]